MIKQQSGKYVSLPKAQKALSSRDRKGGHVSSISVWWSFASSTSLESIAQRVLKETECGQMEQVPPELLVFHTCYNVLKPQQQNHECSLPGVLYSVVKHAEYLRMPKHSNTFSYSVKRILS